MNSRLKYFQIKKREKCISIVAHTDTNFLLGFLGIGVLLLFSQYKIVVIIDTNFLLGFLGIGVLLLFSQYKIMLIIMTEAFHPKAIRLKSIIQRSLI